MRASPILPMSLTRVAGLRELPIPKKLETYSRPRKRNGNQNGGGSMPRGSKASASWLAGSHTTFNNILAGIMGYADLALLQLPASAPARADIEVIKHSVRRAAGLTQRILAYSGKGTFIVEAVNLSQVVEDSRKVLAVFLSKTTTITYSLAASLPMIQVDAAQMCQVVMNLVINASEALGKQGGVIAVSTSALRCEDKDLASMGRGQDLTEGLHICLTVADTGCGMDQQTVARIFDPFFTTKFTGRGLGLATVHGIVRSLKGAILVSSEPGKGTTFRVLLPVSDLAIPPVPNE